MIDHLLVANSPLMLILCATVIVYVCVQSILFMKRAWNRGQEIGMEDKVMKSTILSSALFSIIPSIPILIILLMLMPVLGNYFPWLRLSVIGSGSYENVAVNVTARSFGLESFTDPGFNLSILLSTMWAMTICILYEPLLVLFGTKTLDKGMTKIREKKPMVYTLLIDGVFIALMGWFCAPYLTSWVENRSGLLSLVAMVTAMVAAFIFAFLGKKTQKSIFNELSFPGGMLVGMLGAFITNLIVF